MTVRLICGDCLEVLPTLTGIDAVVTDPPYGMNWDTDCTRFSGGSEISQTKRGKGRDYGCGVVNDDKAFDPSPWLAFPKVILWGFHHFAATLPVGTVLVWLKRNDTAFGTFLSDAELAWMKGGHGVYCMRDLSMTAIARSRVHPTQKPVALMRWCIERLRLPEGATILDPYMGSGTTGIAAVQMGYSFIGCEIDPTYYAIAQRRIAEAQQQLALPLAEAAMT